MTILALDSSGLVASVAILKDNQILAEYSVNYKKTHSQTLLPMLDEVVKMTEFSLDSVDAIAIASGPGSFTGLRIGSATAKGLGLALEKPIISVPTLEGLAINLFGLASDTLICPMMDARRKQVYGALFEFENQQLKVVKAQAALPVEDLLKEINELNKTVIFLGDGVPVYETMIKEQVTVPYSFAPAHMNRQRAASVAIRGQQMFKQGLSESAKEHKPEYLRLSQAERERLEKEKNALS